MLSSTSPTSRISSPSKPSPKKQGLSASNKLSENIMLLNHYSLSFNNDPQFRKPITRAEHEREETWRTIDENEIEKPAKRPKTFEPSDPKFKAAQEATAKLLLELEIANH